MTHLETPKDIVRAIRSTKGLEVYIDAGAWGTIKVIKSVAIEAVKAADPADTGVYAHLIDDDDGPPMLFLYITVSTI